MKFRNTLIMALVLLVLGGFVYFYEIRGRAEREAAEERAAKIVAFETDQVVRVTLSSADQRLVVARSADDGWRLEEPVQQLADATAVDDVLQSLQTAEHERVVAENPEDPATYGLAEPDMTVVLELEDGTEHTVEIGGGTPVGQNVYARRSGEPEVYITPASLKDDLSVELFDLRDKSILTFEEGEIQRLEIRRPDLDLGLTRADAGEAEWRITRPLDVRADSPTVTDLLDGLRQGEAQAFVAESAGPEALAAYGLDAPRLTLTLWTTDDASQTLEIGAASEDPAGYYARRRGGDPVFVVPEDALADVPESVTAIRNRSVVSIPRSRVRWLAVSRGDETVRVERVDTAWEITEPRELEADGSSVSTLIAGLDGLRARDFATESTARGLEDPIARIRVALAPETAGDAAAEGEAPEEGQEEEQAGEQQPPTGQAEPAEEVEVRFGATVDVEPEAGTGTDEPAAAQGADPDGTSADDGTETLRYVAVSGDPTVYLVGEAEIDDVLQGLFDLRSKILVSFTQSELSRLTVEARGTTWTVERSGDTWRLVEPELRAIDDQPVTDLMWELNYLQMQGVGVEWEESIPDLSQYGVAPPAFRLRAWVGEEQVADLGVGAPVPEETVGDDSPPEQVWVRIDDKNGVFRVPGQLRDTAEALVEALAGDR